MFKEMFDLVIYLGVLDPDFLKEMMYKFFRLRTGQHISEYEGCDKIDIFCSFFP
jgi:hypothetical protein